MIKPGQRYKNIKTGEVYKVEFVVNDITNCCKAVIYSHKSKIYSREIYQFIELFEEKNV